MVRKIETGAIVINISLMTGNLKLLLMIKLYHFQSEFQKPNFLMNQKPAAVLQHAAKMIAICINLRQACR